MYRDHRLEIPAVDDAVGWRKLALEDRKTGLASEVALDLWVSERYRPEERSYLAVFVDIVDFGEFNNRYGQHAGDELIHTYGKELRLLCRQIGDDIALADETRTEPHTEDLFARVGGDEALLCYDLNGLKTTDLLDAMDSITERFSSFIVRDETTGVEKRMRAVFMLTTPSNPRNFNDVREDLSEQMVELKKYEKIVKLGDTTLRHGCVQLQLEI